MIASRRRRIWFRNELENQSILFDDPSDLIVAWEAGEFTPMLAKAEAARRAGKWLAGYLSYEAGYLLDPALHALLPEGRRAPLLCLGVFDGPADREALEEASEAGVRTNSVITEPRAAWSSEYYRDRFQSLHAHLRAGDCYQANLTFPVAARWSGDPLWRRSRGRPPRRA